MSRTRQHRICRICCLLLLLCSLLHLAAPDCSNATLAPVGWSFDNSSGDADDNHDRPAITPDSEEPALLPLALALTLPPVQARHPRQALLPTPPGLRSLIAPPE